MYYVALRSACYFTKGVKEISRKTKSPSDFLTLKRLLPSREKIFQQDKKTFDTFIFYNFAPRPAAAVQGVGAVGLRGRHVDPDTQPHPAGHTFVTLDMWLVTRDSWHVSAGWALLRRGPVAVQPWHVSRGRGVLPRQLRVQPRHAGARATWLAHLHVSRWAHRAVLYNCITDHCRR